MIKVRIPTPLQKLTQNQAEVQIDGASLAEALKNLEAKFPGFKERLYDEGGQLRRFINVYVNDEDVRFLAGDKTALKDGDSISIVPAVAGGA